MLESVQVCKCKYKSSAIKSNRGLNFKHPIIPFRLSASKRKLILNSIHVLMHSNRSDLACYCFLSSVVLLPLPLSHSLSFVIIQFLSCLVSQEDSRTLSAVIIMKLEHRSEIYTNTFFYRIPKWRQYQRFGSLVQSYFWPYILLSTLILSMTPKNYSTVDRLTSIVAI